MAGIPAAITIRAPIQVAEWEAARVRGVAGERRAAADAGVPPVAEVRLAAWVPGAVGPWAAVAAEAEAEPWVAARWGAEPWEVVRWEVVRWGAAAWVAEPWGAAPWVVEVERAAAEAEAERRAVEAAPGS